MQAPLPPEHGELLVVLEPYSPPLARLDFSTASLAARRNDGSETPLSLTLVEPRGPAMTHARRWARGQLPAGSYVGLVVRIERASLHRDDGAAALLVPTEPIFVSTPFTIANGEASLLALELDYDRSLGDGYTFRPSFATRAIVADIPQIAGYVTDEASHSVSVFDPQSHRLVGVIPTGETPRGLAIDPARRRAYVALGGGDAIEVIDIVEGEALERLPLRSGDEPRAIALVPNGDVLMVANEGSNTVAFISALDGAELARAPIGDGPTQLLMAPTGQRAYVVNRLSDRITVLDVPNRTVVSELTTASLPLRAALDEAGERLFVLHEGAPELLIFSLPDHVEVARIHVGLDARTLQLDPASRLLYVAVDAPPSILVYDPLSLVPIDSMRLPAPASRLVIDDEQRALLALMPTQRAVAFIELTGHQRLGAVDVGCAPYDLALAGAAR